MKNGQNRMMLDDAQQRVVTFGTGPLLVEAGPGTGKTRVLTERLSFLLNNGLAAPAQLLAITFTNQAAGEISARLGMSRECVRHGDGHPVISTFHRWARMFIKQFSDIPLPSIIDEVEAAQIVSLCIAEAGIKGFKKHDMLKRISLAKQSWPPDLCSSNSAFLQVWERYHAFLKEHNLMDYDDLILEANRLLAESSVRNAFRQAVPFVMVDEFQDVSPAQYSLLRFMVDESGNIMVIGDRHQSIYGFRGSNPLFMDMFVKDFKDVQVVRLSTCYRCPDPFIKSALAVVKAAKDVNIAASTQKHTKIRLHAFRSARAEARWLAHEMERLLGGLSFDSINSGAACGDAAFMPSDIAVLYRNRATGNPVEEALSSIGVPFQHSKGPSPLDDDLLRQIMHLWEMMSGSRKDYHFDMLRKNYKIKPQALKEFTELHKSASKEARLDAIMDFLGIDTFTTEIKAIFHRLKNISIDESMALLVQKEADALDTELEAVSLMSIHAAKGLEFPVIFLIGCEDGIMPWHESDIEEERRIFYVALTRASERLYLSMAEKRRIYGRYLASCPSPFIKEIPSRFKTEMKRHKGRQNRKKSMQLSLF